MNVCLTRNHVKRKLMKLQLVRYNMIVHAMISEIVMKQKGNVLLMKRLRKQKGNVVLMKRLLADSPERKRRKRKSSFHGMLSGT